MGLLFSKISYALLSQNQQKKQTKFNFSVLTKLNRSLSWAPVEDWKVCLRITTSLRRHSATSAETWSGKWEKKLFLEKPCWTLPGWGSQSPRVLFQFCLFIVGANTCVAWHISVHFIWEQSWAVSTKANARRFVDARWSGKRLLRIFRFHNHRWKSVPCVCSSIWNWRLTMPMNCCSMDEEL